MRLFLLGCTGFIGRELVPLLQRKGHSCTLLSRQPASASAGGGSGSGSVVRLQGDPADSATWRRPDVLEALADAEGVVNLAGEPIADQRWTPEHRQRLLDSRLVTTTELVEAMGRLSTPPLVLVNGSAVGYYGNSPSGSFTEASPPAADFLGQLCAQWEAAADRATLGIRVVKLRIGIVLGADGGALGKMLPVFRTGFGGPVGSGRQWMSWIERTDLCRLIAAALVDPAFAGAYNAVAPTPVTMQAFAASLGQVLGRPSLLPVPAPVLQLLLGDGAKVVLEGQQVVPERLQKQGFSFQYPDVASALAAATSPGSR
ncbi:TIGR01777 family oxidoreductase [Synechococcus sp. ATX 2A4]|uniref:TIGR01777 family oxidoreductase n=1 Tax=Synechococcus sp. ATX 2A4 TaxID=2823727 RepID=UPI0020CB95D4|nr:TIGR01777 family oxidoreductase [Synechococcus sp. ATX 2A4]MCP9886062.1 TIGR01777 family oxidoreductase [Synechococcus sp. ATX 2A4]